jgi:hypothetical protein
LNEAIAICRSKGASGPIDYASGGILLPDQPPAGSFIVAEKRGGSRWTVTQNRLDELAKSEQQENVRKKAQEAEDRRKGEEAEAREKRKQAALADCGARPSLSGGQPSSETYPVAVGDEIRRGNFFCVKTVEYLSPAVNQFGGKAARARFTGYRSSDFQLVVEVRDFAY